MKQIVIIGISHHNTLGVIRALGRKGLKKQLHLILIGNNDFISCSKYISRDRLYKIANDDLIIKTLIDSNIGNEENPAIIICCSDSSIAKLDERKEELGKRFIIPSANSSFGAIKDIMDKNVQSKIATNIGIRVPDSIHIDCTNQRIQSALSNWKYYPCIIKPIDSIQGSKSDIHICQDEVSLYSVIQNSHCKHFVIQKFISKEFEFQLIGCSLNRGEKIIIPGFTRIIRQPQNTNTGFLQYNPIQTFDSGDTLLLANSFIREIGYSGLFSIEYLRGADGLDYFMEINLRNDGNSICVTDAGVNLPFIWCAYNSNESYEIEASKDVTSIYCMPEFDDFVLVLKGQISLKQWLKDVRKTSSFMEFSKDDIYPFIRRLRFFVVFLFRCIFRRHKTH